MRKLLRLVLKVNVVLILFGFFSVAASGEINGEYLSRSSRIYTDESVFSGKIVIDLGFLEKLDLDPTWKEWNKDLHELVYVLKRDIPVAMFISQKIMVDLIKNPPPPDMGLEPYLFEAASARLHFWATLSCHDKETREVIIGALSDRPELYRGGISLEEGVEISANSRNCLLSRKNQILSRNIPNTFRTLSNRLAELGVVEKVFISARSSDRAKRNPG